MHLFSLTGASEGTISMQEGEVLAVVEEDKGDGWTRVRRNNGDEGYIPTSYVTITLNKWGRREKETIISLNCKQFLHWDQSKGSHSTVYPEGDPKKLWFLVREVPQMGRGVVLLLCSSWCSTGYPYVLISCHCLVLLLLLCYMHLYGTGFCLIVHYLWNVRDKKGGGGRRCVLLPFLHWVFMPVLTRRKLGLFTFFKK